MRPTKYIITMIILLFSFFVFSPGYAENIKCESHGFKYAKCEVGAPIIKANVKQQHSNSACIEGDSWGIKNDAIWVKKGCRATFTYKAKPAIKCESHGFNYAECKAGAPIKTADVYIKHSNSACIEGDSWGIENDAIWVDNGCRATFTYKVKPTIKCESHGFKYAECKAGASIKTADIYIKHSNSACIEGYSWGIRDDRDGIWVKNGCRATFVYKAKKKCKKCKPIPVVKEDIKCESHGFKYAECEVGLPIIKANVKQQHSNSACIEGDSWGIENDAIWVDNGCRATFETILIGD